MLLIFHDSSVFHDLLSFPACLSCLDPLCLASKVMPVLINLSPLYHLDMIGTRVPSQHIDLLAISPVSSVHGIVSHGLVARVPVAVPTNSVDNYGMV